MLQRALGTDPGKKGKTLLCSDMTRMHITRLQYRINVQTVSTPIFFISLGWFLEELSSIMMHHDHCRYISCIIKPKHDFDRAPKSIEPTFSKPQVLHTSCCTSQLLSPGMCRLEMVLV